MVDPKRHINILSEEDQLFLNECEEEFKDRFTEDDAEFQAYCAQPSPAPPVLEPWQNRNHHHGGGGGGGGGGDRRHDGGGRGRGRFQHHYHHNNRNRDYRDRPYNRDSGHHGNRYNNNNSSSSNRDNNNRYNAERRY